MNRKQKRESKKQAKLNEKLSENIFLFDKLPNKCDVCAASFDKKNKEMAITWKVVVKEEQKLVRLFCPECCAKVDKIIKNRVERK